jgi:REP-associated tyrosine transposase
MLPSLRTKREYLRQLVADKKRWCRSLTAQEKSLGFLGWHERGYLPHCDFPGLVQFVTFRLNDSLPVSRRREWEHLLAIEDVREKRLQLETYLDSGKGECHLSNSEIARLAQGSLLHFHRQWYELLAWCIMPNHIHVLLHVWQVPLSKLIAAWKKFTGSRALAILRSERRSPDRREGDSFWEREYWDTYMRDRLQEAKAVRYIENNPVKAKLCRTADEWPFGSARFRDRATRELNVRPPVSAAKGQTR